MLLAPETQGCGEDAQQHGSGPRADSGERSDVIGGRQVAHRSFALIGLVGQTGPLPGNDDVMTGAVMESNGVSREGNEVVLNKGRFFIVETLAALDLAAVAAAFRPVFHAHFVLPAGLAAPRGIEALLAVSYLFFDGIGKRFVALHAEQHLVLHLNSPQSVRFCVVFRSMCAGRVSRPTLFTKAKIMPKFNGFDDVETTGTLTVDRCPKLFNLLNIN